MFHSITAGSTQIPRYTFSALTTMAARRSNSREKVKDRKCILRFQTFPIETLKTIQNIEFE